MFKEVEALLHRAQLLIAPCRFCPNCQDIYLIYDELVVRDIVQLKTKM